MSNDIILRSCPFCNQVPEFSGEGEEYLACQNYWCPMYATTFGIHEWNSRREYDDLIDLLTSFRSVNRKISDELYELRNNLKSPYDVRKLILSGEINIPRDLAWLDSGEIQEINELIIRVGKLEKVLKRASSLLANLSFYDDVLKSLNEEKIKEYKSVQEEITKVLYD